MPETAPAFTPEQFVEAMHTVVAERGEDFVYPRYQDGWFIPQYYDGNDPDSVDWDEERAYIKEGHETPTCTYQTIDGQPACIVGAALAKIDPALVPDFGIDVGASAVLADALGVRHSPFDFRTDRPLPTDEQKRLILAASSAQARQDQGDTWGDALRDFDTTLTKED